MLATIAFNHEFFLMAGKIDDVRTDWGLPSELEVCEAFGAQVSPEVSLRVGRVSSQFLGKRNKWFHGRFFSGVMGLTVDKVWRKK